MFFLQALNMLIYHYKGNFLIYFKSFLSWVYLANLDFRFGLAMIIQVVTLFSKFCVSCLDFSVLVNQLMRNMYALYRYDQFGCSKCIEDAKPLKHEIIFRIYAKLQASGWPLILLSRKPERQRNATVEHLGSAGYKDWSSLIMRY